MKFFESFYSPAIQTYKSNNGSDELSDAGHFNYPLYKTNYDDEKIAFDKGIEDFNKGNTENPYLGLDYPNNLLIKAWERGYKNGKLNENVKLNNNKFYVDNKLVGVFEISYGEADDEDYPIQGYYMNIFAFQILPEYRGNGYAKLFIEKLKELAIKKKIKTIVLDDEINNKIANNLYKKYFKLYKKDSSYNYYFIKI